MSADLKEAVLTAALAWYEDASIADAEDNENLYESVWRYKNARLETDKAEEQLTARRELEKYQTAIELIWRLHVRELAHLGYERFSGLADGCIACICALALGRSMDGGASTEDFKARLEALKPNTPLP